MIGVTLRVLILAGVLGGAWLAVALVERRRGRAATGLGLGVTLITSPGCALCPSALAALRHHGVTAKVLDVSAAPRSLGTIRAMPLALLVAENGEIRMRRTGRSVITDAPTIAAAATRLGHEGIVNG